MQPKTSWSAIWEFLCVWVELLEGNVLRTTSIHKGFAIIRGCVKEIDFRRSLLSFSIWQPARPCIVGRPDTSKQAHSLSDNALFTFATVSIAVLQGWKEADPGKQAWWDEAPCCTSQEGPAQRLPLQSRNEQSNASKGLVVDFWRCCNHGQAMEKACEIRARRQELHMQKLAAHLSAGATSRRISLELQPLSSEHHSLLLTLHGLFRHVAN